PVQGCHAAHAEPSIGSVSLSSYVADPNASRCALYQAIHQAVSACSSGVSFVRSVQNVMWDSIASGNRKSTPEVPSYEPVSLPSYRPMPIDGVGIHGDASQMSCSNFSTGPLPCRCPLSNHDGPICADSNGHARWSFVSSSSKVTPGFCCCIRCTRSTNAAS